MAVTSKLRRPSPGDAEAIAAVIAAGFESYRAFAPRGWEPPDRNAELLRERLALPEVWAAVAEEGDEVRGVVAFRPMLSERWSGSRVPGFAHVWLLFVHPGSWRRGVGRSLHDLAVAEMAAQGFRRARLWTPVRAEAARALYNGAGWVECDATFGEEVGLDLVAYELDLEQPRD